MDMSRRVRNVMANLKKYVIFLGTDKEAYVLIACQKSMKYHIHSWIATKNARTNLNFSVTTFKFFHKFF